MLVVEFTLRILVQLRDVDDNLSFCIERNIRAIHWSWRWAFEIYAFTVVATAMARTLELVLARLPVRRTSQMSAASVNHKQSIGCSGHPDAILLLPLSIDSQCVVRRYADPKHARGFKNRPRQ